MIDFSIVIPAKNEERGLSVLIPKLRVMYPENQIIVVDDGSIDGTASLCERHDVHIISHPYSKGNGAAIKSGSRVATSDYLVFMDGDGQHDPSDIPRLLERAAEGFDLVVGARRDKSDQASLMRWSANVFYNRLASWMVNHKIDDLTSGFRCVHRRKLIGFLYLLPNGFSYPTTSTMAFFRAGYSVGFIPIKVSKRLGESHVNILRDGVRFFLIIFKIGTLYSPLKVYFPAAALISGMGIFNYISWALSTGGWRFTNMSTLLMLSGVLIFMLGLLAEQLTNLQYRESIEEDQ